MVQKSAIARMAQIIEGPFWQSLRLKSHCVTNTRRIAPFVGLQLLFAAVERLRVTPADVDDADGRLIYSEPTDVE